MAALGFTLKETGIAPTLSHLLTFKNEGETLLMRAKRLSNAHLTA